MASVADENKMADDQELAALSSWVEYPAETDFPIQNLPYGVYKLKQAAEDAPGRCATRIGDTVVDLGVLADAGLLQNDVYDPVVFTQATLNAFMALGKEAWAAARHSLQALFGKDNEKLRENAELRARALVSAAEVDMLLPAAIGDYTDFYASRYHATNVGIMFRGKDNALQPNWTWLPVGYHGRASSVVVSGTPIRRPQGQLMAEGAEKPELKPARLMDFEMEVGVFVGGPGNKLGEPIPINRAQDAIFGYVLMNDWSARDIQRWEYVPLGPFGAKNLGTSISPWIVTPAALAAFKRPLEQEWDPAVLDYLRPKEAYTLDIQLQVGIQAPDMAAPHTVSTTNFKYLYWMPEQMLAHHTITGCNMRAGDLFGSGTISGPEPHEYGSMLELSWKGTKVVPLPNGQERKFLADNDVVSMTGFAQGPGYRIGFGECAGKLLPARPLELAEE